MPTRCTSPAKTSTRSSPATPFHVTESGVFTFTDTIRGGAANGCDSIIVRYLIVEEPHEDEICDSTFNVSTQTWTDNVGPYEWNGTPIADLTVNADGYYEFPGEKTINGTKVDTTTYLKLTIDPTHRDTNALDICLLGSDSTFTYEGNTNVTISVTTTTTTVTSTDATKVTVYPVKVGGEESKTDFILLMKTHRDQGRAARHRLCRHPTHPRRGL